MLTDSFVQIIYIIPNKKHKKYANFTQDKQIFKKCILLFEKNVI